MILVLRELMKEHYWVTVRIVGTELGLLYTMIDCTILHYGIFLCLSQALGISR